MSVSGAVISRLVAGGDNVDHANEDEDNLNLRDGRVGRSAVD